MDDTSFSRFETIEDAEKLLEKEVDDPYFGPFRHAKLKDAEAMAAYALDYKNGCCGELDVLVYVGSDLTLIGCNYGH